MSRGPWIFKIEQHLLFVDHIVCIHQDGEHVIVTMSGGYTLTATGKLEEFEKALRAMR